MTGSVPASGGLAGSLRRIPLVRRLLRGPYRVARRGLRAGRHATTAATRRVRTLGAAVRRPFRARAELSRWEAAGRPVPPPPIFKQRLVREYGRRRGIRLLVETGTYRGDMVAAQRRHFRRIWSMELQPDLADRARRRFARDRHVTILAGDSSVLLPEVLASIQEPCLFWLDAHYSAGVTARGDVDTPIAAEIDAVLRHPVAGHVVLIDDARDFTGHNDYPTVEALMVAIRERKPDWEVAVRDDVIRAHARGRGVGGA